MCSVLLHNTQDDWGNQRVSAAKQERTITSLSRRSMRVHQRGLTLLADGQT